jgi:hypothetical protein
MSGLFKEIGKVFSAVWDFVRPIVEVVAVAAAVYFTAGVAMSYFPATSAFAAALPGFASTGGIAGEGVFSSLASSIGLGGGLQAGAGADIIGADAASAAASGAVATANTADTATLAAQAAPAADTAVGSTAASAAGPSAASQAIQASANQVASATIPAAGTGGGTAGALAKGMSLTDKLLFASVGTNLVSGLTAPSPTDIASAKAGFYGSFYGTDSNGASSAAPNLSVGPQTEPQNTSTVGAFAPMPGVNIPSVQPAAQATPGFQGVQKPSLIPVVPSGVASVPGAAQSNQVAGTTPLAQPQLIKGSSFQPTAPATTPGATPAQPQLIPTATT